MNSQELEPTLLFVVGLDEKFRIGSALSRELSKIYDGASFEVVNFPSAYDIIDRVDQIEEVVEDLLEKVSEKCAALLYIGISSATYTENTPVGPIPTRITIVRTIDVDGNTDNLHSRLGCFVQGIPEENLPIHNSHDVLVEIVKKIKENATPWLANYESL